MLHNMQNTIEQFCECFGPENRVNSLARALGLTRDSVRVQVLATLRSLCEFELAPINSEMASGLEDPLKITCSLVSTEK